MDAHLFGELTPALEARRRLIGAVSPIARVETLAVDAAFGRIAARTVRTPRAVPPFARATWDGYAVRSEDVRAASRTRPVGLRVVGEVFAEQTYPHRLLSGEAVAIATGGALPPGADAVEIFEEVRRAGPTVTLEAPVRRGARIAPRGDDFRPRTLIARKDERLTPATLGALAACGVARVAVYARPRVAIVPNGNELRAPGSRTGPGEIFESNNASLAAAVTACGAEPLPLPPTRDDPREIAAALRSAVRSCDLVLSTGGSSVGEHDHLPTIFPKLGRLLFHGVAVRPGKPTLAARCGTTLLVGLPGHPTSCLLDMYWMVLPVVRRLARLPGPGWSPRTARWTGPPARRSPGFSTAIPLRVRGERVASTFHSSSAIRSLHAADGFVLLPPGTTSVRAGERLQVCVLDPPLGPGSG